jgi:hypothetical protein
MADKSNGLREATNQRYPPNQGNESMLLRFRLSLATVVEQRSASNRWQAVALEVANGAGTAVLLIGSMAAGLALIAVLAAMSSQS